MGRQDNDSECFIDLEKVTLSWSNDALQQFRNRADGKQSGIAGAPQYFGRNLESRPKASR